MSRHHWYIVSKSRIVPIVIRVVDWKLESYGCS
uniref:Uncharacterized protein n=1 Tax=Anguilla anguilla TaxID=7936 RepID=A0A0E9RG53_ANGAN